MAKYKIIPSSRTIVQSPISIGHKAEKGVEAIEFDLTAWVETYGSGTATIIMRRWGDAIPYPIALEIDENNKATWTLSDTDTAKAGMAYAQLSYIVGDTVVKKSDIYTFRVMDSLTGEGEPPEAYESWLEHLTHLTAEAMAEVLDIEGIVTDKTLTVDGGIADGKATGDALALKADKSTTYTKTEVDRMIEGVEIETDTTLEVAGAAADAAETGRQIDLLKADLDDVDESLDAISEFSTTINICDDVLLKSRTGIIYNSGVFTGKASDFFQYVLLDSGFEEGKRYTVSFYGQNTGSNVSGNGIGVRINYTNGSYNAQYLPNSTSEYARFTAVSETGKTVSSILLYYNSGGANVWNIKEIQVEKGTTATQYVAHSIYTAVDSIARELSETNSAEIVNVQKTSVQASEERIDSYSKYQSFNDLPVGEIVNLFSNIKLADGPQGYNPIGHNNSDDGKYNATVLTYSAETNPRAIVQVCIFYVSGGFTHDKEPRTAIRYAIKTNETIVWSNWSTMSSNMVLHSSDKVVDINSYSTVTFADFNDAEPNAIYQVDLNVGNTILNNPSPGHSGLLMTFSFSPVSHHALVQNFYAIEETGIEMYFRYGYKQSSADLTWTEWKKVATDIDGKYSENKGRLASGTDLNSLTDNAVYLMGYNYTYVNRPWESLAGFITTKTVGMITLQVAEGLDGVVKRRMTADGGTIWTAWT